MRVYFICAMSAGLASVQFVNSQDAIDYLGSEQNPNSDDYIPTSAGWFDATNLSGIRVRTLAEVQANPTPITTGTTVSVTNTRETRDQTLAEAEAE